MELASGFRARVSFSSFLSHHRLNGRGFGTVFDDPNVFSVVEKYKIPPRRRGEKRSIVKINERSWGNKN